jgi:hypothetical protein
MGRPTVDPRTQTTRRWIGLEEASSLLGISATTLRRWSDAGLVETFVTPGGHRRFNGASVEALLPGALAHPTMGRLGETPERMSQVYRRASERRTLPWVDALDESQRNAFRERGRIVASELLATLDASTESDRATHLATASETAAQYGIAAAARGIPVSATVETFLRFRRPFLLELAAGARRRGLDASAATDLIARASDGFDQLLVATMRAYEESVALAKGSRGKRGAAAPRTGDLELPASIRTSGVAPTPASTPVSKRGTRAR